MFIRNSDRTKLSFPSILIRDQEQRSQIREKFGVFFFVRLQHIQQSSNQASVMFSVVCLKNDRITACLLEIFHWHMFSRLFKKAPFKNMHCHIIYVRREKHLWLNHVNSVAIELLVTK